MKTLIRNVKLFDGETVYAHSSILFDESGILEVGEGPLDADVCIDGSGKTLTPGLIDGHVHLGGEGMAPTDTDRLLIRSGAKIAAQAQLVWRYGITTVCNCATASDADIHVRDLIRERAIPGCRIIACGKGISITGGHGWPMNHQCDDEVSALTAARTQVREGADLIKFFATGGMATKGSVPNAPQLTESQMRVCVEYAETVGALTRAHATGLEGAKNVARAGVRIIDHVPMDEETSQIIAEHGSWYCPTIVTRYNILRTEDPRYQFMKAKASPMDLERKKRALALCREKGIPVIAGTDAGTGAMTLLGESLWTELGIYVEYGMTPIEALTSATSNAARALKLEGTTGRVAAGLAADLALFEGDPTEDIRTLATVCMTFNNGTLVWKK